MSKLQGDRASLERSVILCARRFTRVAAEFPDDPSIWSSNAYFGSQRALDFNGLAVVWCKLGVTASRGSQNA